jgi:hypothetical protein
MGGAIGYSARPEPLFLQAVAESTRIDIAARVYPNQLIGSRVELGST